MTTILAVTVNDVAGRGMTVSTNFRVANYLPIWENIFLLSMCPNTTVVTLSMHGCEH